ncbi:LPXTG cell wall anchor domain-containing protein [Streptomyces filamentosus]|uniref:LPXTG cell wall anchor domain-containing protein n=1 Tax=Streptomyces filamentosus TaxID=67294 RepID=UPI0036E9CB85
MRRSLIPAATLVAAMAGSLALAPTAFASGGPKGDNGTVKIHDSKTGEEYKQNEPKVCEFYLDAFNFDAQQKAEWHIEAWAVNEKPKGETVEEGLITLDAEGHGRTEDMTLADGQYKLFWKFDGEKGSAKHKVFKVECEDENPATGGTTTGETTTGETTTGETTTGETTTGETTGETTTGETTTGETTTGETTTGETTTGETTTGETTTGESTATGETTSTEGSTSTGGTATTGGSTTGGAATTGGADTGSTTGSATGGTEEGNLAETGSSAPVGVLAAAAAALAAAGAFLVVRRRKAAQN